MLLAYICGDFQIGLDIEPIVLVQMFKNIHISIEILEIMWYNTYIVIKTPLSL